MSTKNSGEFNNEPTIADQNSGSDSASVGVQDSELEAANGGFFDINVTAPVNVTVDAKASANTTIKNKKFLGLF